MGPTLVKSGEAVRVPGSEVLERKLDEVIGVDEKGRLESEDLR